MDIRAKEVIFVPHQLHSRKTTLMAQNKTIVVALLLATIVAVMAEVPPMPETPERTLRTVCKEDCSEQKSKAPIDEKQCEDFCFIKIKNMLEAHRGVSQPTADRFKDFCNNGCNTEYKKDSATSKKCAESCDVDAKEAEEFFAKLATSKDILKQHWLLASTMSWRRAAWTAYVKVQEQIREERLPIVISPAPSIATIKSPFLPLSISDGVQQLQI